MDTILFCGNKPWSYDIYHYFRYEAEDSDISYFASTSVNTDVYFIDKEEDLTFEYVQEINPKYIFFVHWSYYVPDEITENYTCLCFHPSHLPYGRGGSPIQNLISRGFTETKLSVFKMTHELDTGPLYAQIPLSLKGAAREIYKDIADKTIDIVKSILESENTVFVNQNKEDVVNFKRRIPGYSEITDNLTLNSLWDHMRMLDAPTYPYAYLDYNGFRYEFYSVSKGEDYIQGNFEVRKINGD